MDALIGALSGYARHYFSRAESSLVTRARHRQALEETVAALDRALARGAIGERGTDRRRIALGSNARWAG